MSTSSHLTSSGQNTDQLLTPKRRQACEHCRAQKLKCIRDQNNPTGPCFRCTDARKSCVTDTRRRVGRPSRNQSVTQQPQWDVASAQNDASLQENSCYPTLDLFSTSRSSSWLADDFSLDTLSVDLSEFADISNSFAPASSSLFLDPTILPKQDGIIGSSASTLVDEEAGGLQHSGSESELQLLQLQQDLMNLVIRLRKRSWDIVATLKMELQDGTSGRNDSMETFFTTESAAASARQGPGSSDFNPLIATFDLVARFDQLLRSKVQALYGQRAQPITGAAAKLSNHISSQYLLGVVACYMHILSAYDCIVSYVLHDFARNEAVRDFILFGAPRITIGGTLAPPLVNTLGRLLVKLLETKILPVELVLGLPDAVRISKDNTGMQSIRAFSLLGGTVAGKSVLSILEDANLESHSGDAQSVGMYTLRERMDSLCRLGS